MNQDNFLFLTMGKILASKDFFYSSPGIVDRAVGFEFIGHVHIEIQLLKDLDHPGLYHIKFLTWLRFIPHMKFYAFCS